MRERIVLVAVLVGLASRPSAQTSAVIRTASEFVTQTTSSGNVLRRSIPAGLPITVAQTVYSYQNFVTATATIAPRGAFGMQMSGVANALGGFLLVNSAWLGGVVEWSVAGSGRGWLTVELAADVMLLLGATARLDVSAPGINESHWLVAGSPSLARRITRFVAFSSGLRATTAVQLTSDTPLGRTTYATANVHIDFVPALPPVSQVTYGATCGATLTVTDATTLTSHDVQLDVTGAFPSATVAYLFGGDRDDIPIPGSQCRVLTAPIAAVAVLADRSGRASLSYALPGPLQSATFDVQALAFDAALQVRTSAGVELQFVD